MTMSAVDMIAGRRSRRQNLQTRSRPQCKTRQAGFGSACLAVAAVCATALLTTANASAQTAAPTGGQYIACAASGQPLVRIPELVSKNGKLRGAIVLSVETNRMKEKAPGSDNDCVRQYNRAYRAVNGTLPDYPGTTPPGFAGYKPPANQGSIPFSDPLPGPTLRAHVGDLIELSFINQIDTGVFVNSVDRGERFDPSQGCDLGNGTVSYPYSDRYPDCFHGSSTGNIHFHGTHTNPSSTGDNVFIEVRPSPRNKNNQPTVTPGSVQGDFAQFFAACEKALSKSQLSQWPYSWNDMPASWTRKQKALLQQYDANPNIKNKLWPVDAAQIAVGGWPQYYIGAYPYCYRLPAYQEPAAPTMPAHAGMIMPPPEVLHMGQAPGTHWYHSHKHGSTTINVTNGMTGAFIIEGKYDEQLDAFYGKGWMRKQPIIEIQELNGPPNLFAGGNSTPADKIDFVVNGLPKPTIAMQPGEVQLWRIINSAARSGAYFSLPAGVHWRQIAQDGVQFSPANYWNSADKPFLMAAGNRADILVQAPTTAGNVDVKVVKTVKDTEIYGPKPNAPITLLTMAVGGTPASGPQSQFVPQNQAPTLPAFLFDITADQVKGTKRIVFESLKPVPTPEHPALPAGPPFTRQTIDGKEFDGEVGEVVLLNNIEEWTIANRSVGPVINHPFHIHINPFQVVEVFDPNAPLRDSNGNVVEKTAGVADPLPLYIVSTTSPATPTNPADPKNPRLLKNGQCWVNPDFEATWRPCGQQAGSDLIWWDVFPIPAGTKGTDTAGKAVVIPGYFKMRSRFVDYKGFYVLHCHILAHEDRGMMTVVEVVPRKTIYAHH
ncbi:MAG: multicopper oxidase domain-containing protein [Rhodopseudomonas sp.]|nr:multicopper oxidase domain-containing protein [Rhodopseudomonas sp.]